MIFILLVYCYLQYKFPSTLFNTFVLFFEKTFEWWRSVQNLLAFYQFVSKWSHQNIDIKHLPLLLWSKILVSIPYFQIILSFDDMEVLIKFLWGVENFFYSFMACCLPILPVTFVLWVLLVILRYNCYSWYFDGKFLYISYWL